MTQRQSPIDIDRSGVVDGDLRPIDVRYPVEPVEVEIRFGIVDGDETPDGVTVVPQLIGTPVASDAHVIVDGRRFDLQSFHWHSPSEHLIDGEALPLELHLVHASPDGELLVIGVLFTAGTEDAVIAPAFDTIATVMRGSRSVAMRLADLVPANPRTYRYDGSLTTAPFTEGVSWVVCADLRTASTEQFDAHEGLVLAHPPGFEDRPVTSARSVQATGDRLVVTEGRVAAP